MSIKNKVHLITYVDRLSGGGFSDMKTLLETSFKDLFGGVHFLPFFEAIDGADAGFDPIDHTQVDQRLGDWRDLSALSDTHDLMADIIVNHMSVDSPQFQDYLQKGDESKYASLFLSLADVFENGATEKDLLAIYRPRPGLPFTAVKFPNGNSSRLLWATFTAKQIDIDVLSAEGEKYLDNILAQFQTAGVKLIRLDAAGYAIKKPGTSCFMLEETFDFIEEFRKKAHKLGMLVLVEVHSYYKQQIEIAKRVDLVYDFAMPPLVLHALLSGDCSGLKAWLPQSPRNCITVLDTHDGIGIIDVARHGKDKPGILTNDQVSFLVEEIHNKSRGESRKATGAAASNLDLYQVNCTFYDALGGNDQDYLLSRLIQFSCPGIPQVYYMGLLAGKNDMDLLGKTGVGRDINRHYYTPDEISQSLQRPVVNDLFSLIHFRNSHPAFNGEFTLLSSPLHEFSVSWSDSSTASDLSIKVDLKDKIFTVISNIDGLKKEINNWCDLMVESIDDNDRHDV